MVLELVAEDAEDPANPFTPAVQSQIQGVLANCNKVVQDIQECIQQHRGPRVQKGLRWVSKGKAEMDKLRSLLEAHKSAFNLLLEMINSTTLKEVKATTQTIDSTTQEIQATTQEINTATQDIKGDTSALKQGIENIRFDSSKISEIHQLLHDLQERIANSAPENPQTFMLQRYLDEISTTYAESVVDDSEFRKGWDCGNELSDVDEEEAADETKEKGVPAASSLPLSGKPEQDVDQAEPVPPPPTTTAPLAPEERKRNTSYFFSFKTSKSQESTERKSADTKKPKDSPSPSPVKQQNDGESVLPFSLPSCHPPVADQKTLIGKGQPSQGAQSTPNGPTDKRSHQEHVSLSMLQSLENPLKSHRIFGADITRIPRMAQTIFSFGGGEAKRDYLVPQVVFECGEYIKAYGKFSETSLVSLETNPVCPTEKKSLGMFTEGCPSNAVDRLRRIFEGIPTHEQVQTLWRPREGGTLPEFDQACAAHLIRKFMDEVPEPLVDWSYTMGLDIWYPGSMHYTRERAARKPKLPAHKEVLENVSFAERGLLIYMLDLLANIAAKSPEREAPKTLASLFPKIMANFSQSLGGEGTRDSAVAYMVGDWKALALETFNHRVLQD
ncbi:hypothetical protein ACJZ2D_002437 [Fusarium nematophilum]